MKIIKVTYTSKPDFVNTNKGNIETVMSDLRKLAHPGLKYATYLSSDGKTFMHFAQFENDEAEQTLQALESFKSFQRLLKESGPEAPPQQEVMTMVASCFDIF